MLQMSSFIPLDYLIISLMVITFILFVLLIISLFSIKNIKKRINTILGNQENMVTIEDALNQYYIKIENYEKEHHNIKREINNINSKIENIDTRLQRCSQKVGIIRYNPFNNMGGDLSYALALLDEKNNGFVINTIFNRDGSMTYCKPIENGTSKYQLSEEEMRSVKKAIDKK